jgi:hypothetical protein
MVEIDVTSREGRQAAVDRLRELEQERPANPHVETLLATRDKLNRKIIDIDQQLRNAKQVAESDERARQQQIGSLRRQLEESAGALDPIINALDREIEAERLRPLGPFAPPGLAANILTRVQQLQALRVEALEAKATAIDPEAAAAAIWTRLPAPARAAAS